MAGLGLIPGMVRRLPDCGLKIPPHGVEQRGCKSPARCWTGCPEEPYVYFVHSYACEAQRPEDVLTTTEYGRPFHSAGAARQCDGYAVPPGKIGTDRPATATQFRGDDAGRVRKGGVRPVYAKRIIPCLDIKDGRVVKGTNFLNLRDAGDR